jgi:TPR repeat protein
MLGLMFYEGQDVPQDYAEAVQWFQKAAEQGDGDSQLKMGVMYTNGQGVVQDYVQAHKWLSLAASRFSASEAEERDLAVQYRHRVAAEMTLAQIAEAQKFAREWQPK